MTGLQIFACVLAAGRILLGLAPIVAAAPLARLLGFPEAHNTPSTRLFARLFGVRDIGLGVLVLCMLPQPELLRWSFVFNAFHDLGDILMIAVPLVRQQGINRAAGLSLGFACIGLSAWLLACWWSLSI